MSNLKLGWTLVLSIASQSCADPSADDFEGQQGTSELGELSDKASPTGCSICGVGRIVNPQFRFRADTFPRTCGEIQESVFELAGGTSDKRWCDLNRVFFKSSGCLCDPPLIEPTSTRTFKPVELCAKYSGAVPDAKLYTQVTLVDGSAASCTHLQNAMRKGLSTEYRSEAAALCCVAGADGQGGGGTTGEVYGDSLVWQFDANGQVSEWRFVGGKPKGAALVDKPPASSWRLIGSGDMNGDGTDDMVWWDTASGNVNYWAMRDGKRTHDATLGAVAANGQWALKTVGDMDGDGTDDLIWWHSSGLVHYWRIVGGKWVGSGNVGTIVQSSGWDLKATGDVNGDGVDELIWVNGQQLVFWHLESMTYKGKQSIASYPVGKWELVASGDLDGDRTDDLIWRDLDQSNLLVSRMVGSAIKSQTGIGKAPSGWRIRGAGDLHGSD